MKTKRLSLDHASGQWLADLAALRREDTGGNAEQLLRLRKNLRSARQQILTPRQQEILTLYYDQGMNMRQIAALLEVNPSTVSRTLRRARQRLYQALRYTL